MRFFTGWSGSMWWVAVLSWIAGGFFSAPLLAGERVRVGVHENGPAVFIDAGGEAGGFHIDLLRDAAAKRGWSLEFIAGSRRENRDRLLADELDLLVDVDAATAAARGLQTGARTILSDWGRIYVRDRAIRSLPDLDGSHIVGVAGDPRTTGLKSLLEAMDVAYTFQDVPWHDAVLKRVAAAKADAGVVPRTFGLINARRFAVHDSGIVCCPRQRRFAVAAGRHADLLRALDDHLESLKADRRSLYWRSFHEWYGRPAEQPLSGWVWAGLMAALLVAALLVMGFLLLRRRLERHSGALRREINERKQVDIRLRQSYEQLTARNRELESAREQAEHATRTKEVFVANMGHELRTPLNTTIGMLDLVLRDEPAITSRGREYLNQAKTAALSLSTLLNSILDLSTIDKGEVKPRKMVFNLRELVVNACSLQAEKARAKDIGISWEIDASVPNHFRGDPESLSRILGHLLDNAVKFTDGGRITVTVRMVSETAGGEVVDRQDEAVHFSVRDTGIGVPREKMAAIFNSFTQGDGSSSRRYGGIGIGLSIAKRLVALLEGRIWVESPGSGQGSTFHFLARFESADGDETAVAAETIPAHKSLRILLAEDVAEDTALAIVRLEQRGHQVTVARNGHQAIAAFDNGFYDLLLMDLQMPGMDGFAATRAIRERERKKYPGARLPIIAITASSDPDIRDKCLAADMDGQIGKPLDLGKMFTVLARVSHHPAPNAGMVPPVETDGKFPLPPLPGIDVEAGLATWGGDSRAYRTALAGFRRGHAGDLHGLHEALEKKDHAAAKRISHALKGVAGNLAATDLARAATALDVALLKGETDLQPLLIRVEETMAVFMDSCARLSPATDGGRAGGPETGSDSGDRPDPELIALMGRFYQQLADADPSEADTTLPELRSGLAGLVDETTLARLAAQVEDFDYRAARETLAAMAGTLGDAWVEGLKNGS